MKLLRTIMEDYALVLDARLTDNAIALANPGYAFPDENGEPRELRAYGPRVLRLLAARDLIHHYWVEGVVCGIRGHDLRDDDPGDPEVGPDPHINCRRCGRSW